MCADNAGRGRKPAISSPLPVCNSGLPIQGCASYESSPFKPMCMLVAPLYLFIVGNGCVFMPSPTEIILILEDDGAEMEGEEWDRQWGSC